MVLAIIKEIESCIKTENFLGALSLALTLPDICGKAHYPREETSFRYRKWYEENIGKYDVPMLSVDDNLNSRSVEVKMPYLNGEMLYSLRNSFFHQGTLNVSLNKNNLTVSKESGCSYIDSIEKILQQNQVGIDTIQKVRNLLGMEYELRSYIDDSNKACFPLKYVSKEQRARKLLETLDLRVGTYNMLKRAGINTLGEVAVKSDKELRDLGCTAGQIRDIKRIL